MAKITVKSKNLNSRTTINLMLNDEMIMSTSMDEVRALAAAAGVKNAAKFNLTTRSLGSNEFKLKSGMNKLHAFIPSPIGEGKILGSPVEFSGDTSKVVVTLEKRGLIGSLFKGTWKFEVKTK